MSTKLHHDRNSVLSYNPLLAFVCLDRGIGKSFGYYSLAVDNYLKHKQKFVYIRRYKEDCKLGRDAFFKDIAKNYPTHKFTVKGNSFYCDGHEFGIACPMTKCTKLKSMAFPDTSLIIFDEFIPENENERYLPNEPELLASLMVTVFRDRNGRVIMLGNKTKSMTPYNIYFNLPAFNENYYDKDRRVLIYCNDKVKSKDIYKDTPVYNLLKGTRYFSYAYENKSLKNDTINIRKRIGGTQICLFVLDNYYIGMYYSNKCIYFDDNTDKTFKICYSLTKDNINERAILFTKANYENAIIKTCFKQGRLYYTSLRVKELIGEFIDKIGY